MAKRLGHLLEQVLAVSCDSTTAGPVTASRFFVAEGPCVLVSMTIQGMFPASQISETVEQQLVAGVASSLEISRELVKLEALKDNLRRLLALSSTFRVLASDITEATKLLEKVQRADMEVIHMFIGVCS
jgi:hypothetical protein